MLHCAKKINIKLPCQPKIPYRYLIFTNEYRGFTFSKSKFRNSTLIFCDELRADALGCFGNDIVQTPNINRMAQKGTVFTQCMVTQPTCTPCRASILTGCYPSALHSRMVGCVTPDDPRFLPRVFAGHGYRTASIGQIHLEIHVARAFPREITDYFYDGGLARDDTCCDGRG